VAPDVARAVAANGVPAPTPQAGMKELLKLQLLWVLVIVAVLLLGAVWWLGSDSSTHTAATAAATYHSAAAAVAQLWHVLVNSTWAWLATYGTPYNLSVLAAAALVCALVATAVKHKVCVHI
jgi:hypothetical protein